MLVQIEFLAFFVAAIDSKEKTELPHWEPTCKKTDSIPHSASEISLPEKTAN